MTRAITFAVETNLPPRHSGPAAPDCPPGTGRCAASLSTFTDATSNLGETVWAQQADPIKIDL